MTVFAAGRDTGLVSVVGAVVLADFLNKCGLEAVPASPGRPEPAAAQVLRRFGLKRPWETVSLAGCRAVLVGTFPPPAGVEVLAHLDPCRPVAFAPVHVLSAGRPEGGYASFLKAVYDDCGMELSSGLAGGLLCLLLAETGGPAAAGVRKTAETLARLAGVADAAALGRELS